MQHPRPLLSYRVQPLVLQSRYNSLFLVIFRDLNCPKLLLTVLKNVMVNNHVLLQSAQSTSYKVLRCTVNEIINNFSFESAHRNDESKITDPRYCESVTSQRMYLICLAAYVAFPQTHSNVIGLLMFYLVPKMVHYFLFYGQTYNVILLLQIMID